MLCIQVSLTLAIFPGFQLIECDILYIRSLKKIHTFGSVRTNMKLHIFFMLFNVFLMMFFTFHALPFPSQARKLQSKKKKKIVRFIKIFDLQFWIDLHVLGCPEHDLITSGKCLSVCL